GVHVYKTGTADVQVFQGRVDAQHRASGEERSMQTGARLRFSHDAVAKYDPTGESSAAVQGPAPAEGVRLLQLTTASGRGKDAYGQPVFPPPPPQKNMSDILLLVKNTVDTKPAADWVRKAYLGFDLAPLVGMRVVEAQLMLTFAPTHMGFA